MKRLSLVGILSTSLLIAAASAQAASWPERPITLVVPFSAGGSTDATARMIAERLGPELGQTVIVDNRPGAGSNIGGAHVAKSNPDGYTLLLATSTMATNVSLYSNMGFDVRKDLVPVSQISWIPNVWVVNKKVPLTTLAEAVDYIKQKKGNFHYGSAGNGSSQHLSGAMLNNMLSGDMTHVPYKGGAPANADLLAGHIEGVFAPLSEVLPHIDSGSLRALAVTTKNRSDRLPDVPAVSEVLPDYEIALWNGIFAPAGTPPDVLDKLAGAINKVTKDPDLRKTFDSQGLIPVGSSPSEFKEVLAVEIDKLGKLVSLSGAKID